MNATELELHRMQRILKRAVSLLRLHFTKCFCSKQLSTVPSGTLQPQASQSCPTLNQIGYLVNQPAFGAKT